MSIPSLEAAGAVGAFAVALALCAAPASLAAAQPVTAAKADRSAAPARKAQRSGRSQVGKASIYARKFTGRTMADGTPMSPHDDNAASKTLPLGSKARVKNLETGESTVVTIQDRGPHVPGRIVDLSPRSASEIGLTQREGLAPVQVTPLPAPGDGGGERKEQ